MHSPVEKKFNEYLGNIHRLLHDDTNFLSNPAFVNQLLDKMEYIKRNFILLSAEKEDVFTYQNYLNRLTTLAQETQEWVNSFSTENFSSEQTFGELKENLFLLSDMFATSRNLINSFYPAN